MLQIYTGRINSKDPDRLDVTVKSGAFKWLAPTWDMVMGYKAGRLSKEAYTAKYLTILRKQHDRLMQYFSTKDRVVLTCYCGKNEFCHRKLLAEYLAKHLPDAVYHGELQH